MVARRNFPKHNIFEQKTQKMLIICQIDWREVGVAFELQCLRNCTLCSLFCCCIYVCGVALCALYAVQYTVCVCDCETYQLSTVWSFT